MEGNGLLLVGNSMTGELGEEDTDGFGDVTNKEFEVCWA
jgi:hypothetical protein